MTMFIPKQVDIFTFGVYSDVITLMCSCGNCNYYMNHCTLLDVTAKLISNLYPTFSITEREIIYIVNN